MCGASDIGLALTVPKNALDQILITRIEPSDEAVMALYYACTRGAPSPTARSA